MTNIQNRNKNQATKVIIPCRISFANIWEPRSINGSEEKYSVSCIIPKDDKKTIARIQSAVEAAKELGISTARVAQLCKAELLTSWKVGRTRMVSVESVETRLAEKSKPGRPRKETSVA